MAGYNAQITRTDAESLILEDHVNEIFQAMPQSSTVMQLGRRLRDMTAGTQRLSVLSSLAQAYFPDGDNGLIPLSDMAWADKYVEAGKIAAIIGIPEDVLDDASYDIWAESKPSIAEALGLVFDQAVYYGTGAPTNWPTSLVAQSLAAGHTVSLASFPDAYDAILGEGGVNSFVEADGYAVNGHVASLSMKSKLRGLRSSQGEPIFMQAMIQNAVSYALDGAPLVFPTNGAVVPASSLLISGDWRQLVWSLRKDVTYKVLTEAVITDATGKVVYNFAQQDQVGLRVTMRCGWQLPNPINRVNSDATTRLPFAVLTA